MQRKGRATVKPAATHEDKPQEEPVTVVYGPLEFLLVLLKKALGKRPDRN